EEKSAETARSKPADRTPAPIQAFRQVTLELVMYPPVRRSGPAHSFAIGLPSVPVSSFEITFRKTVGEVELRAGERTARFRGVARAALPLGKVQHLSVTWEPQKDSSSVKTRSLEADTACVVEVQHTLLRYHYRVTYHPDQAEVTEVVWRMPAGTVIRPQDVAADDVLGVRLRSTSGSLELHVVFAHPKTEDFSVEASWVAPVPVPGGKIDLPLAVLPVGVRDGATQRVALIPPTGFHLEQRKAASTPTNAISTDAFRQAWGGLLSARNMELAYQVQAPTVLPISLVPRQAEQTVRADQVLHVHRGRIEWSLHAEIETKQAPAFQYVLRVDPRLRIESVSVKQEDAERLAHWAVTARNRLVLFLKDATSDVQYVTLKGHLPVSRGIAVPVPVVQFENAKHLPGTLRVYRDPDVALAWEGKKPTRAGEEQPAAQPAGAELFEGRFV
ncbi:MAG: hypothetical protein GXP27_01515, partial [Planctomycetes bacterium]|nr:hypothetical protein [Planctomycetota bacterium]